MKEIKTVLESRLSIDVRLPKEQQPIFPPRCVACGSDAPGGTLRFHTHSIGWSTIALWSSGKRFSADVPVCGNCRGKVNQQRWLRFSIRISLIIIIVVVIAGWLLTDLQVPLKADPSGSIVGKVLGRLLTDYLQETLMSWLMLGIALVCLYPLSLWEVLFPPPFDMTAYSNSVDYQFRDADYAEEFAMLNIAAGEATISANSTDIAVGNNEILPEEIFCPDCGASLKLSQKERIEKKFACSVCKETFLVKE